MQEDFLHFVWRFQHFDKQHLTTTDGKPLQILQTGKVNTDAGADFSEARVVIDGLTWAGTVEIHLRSSDWQHHRHDTNAAYENVVLHVVWQHDKAIFRQDATPLPTLELDGKVNSHLLARYKSLLANALAIPCQAEWQSVEAIYKWQMLDFALMQRLEQKAAGVQQLLFSNQQDWEETAYQVLARNFGFKINSEAFLSLAQRLPLKIIQKHADNLLQTEALLFGQAGLLETAAEDEYVRQLKKEYAFLSHKYNLHQTRMNAVEWKLLRLRPANFPHLRIAQFAAFLQKNPNVFSTLLHAETTPNLKKSFDLQPSPYWNHHYLLGKVTEASVPDFGKSSLENVLINSVVPLLVCYAGAKDNTVYIEKAVSVLESLPAEKNTITNLWKELGLKVANAFDSQASIELYNHFCSQKKCLSCKIGNLLITR